MNDIIVKPDKWLSAQKNERKIRIATIAETIQSDTLNIVSVCMGS